MRIRPEDPVTERYLRWVRCACPWEAVRTPARLAQEAQRKRQAAMAAEPAATETRVAP
jgi:hypothetical protein